MRSFTAPSLLDEAGLALELAPALTPQGLTETPGFFSGFAAQPLVLARGLLVLADVAQTRYIRPRPAASYDPICTANGDRIRMEAFSACNTVAVRLDLLSQAFDGGDIRHGTTNVDLNRPLREALAQIRSSELMHLSIGADELRVSTPQATHVERKVDLPERWIKALGSSQELSTGLELIGETPAAPARRFLASLTDGPGRAGAWTVSRTGVRPALRPGPGTVHAEGLNRLRSARRLIPQVTGLRVYGAPGAQRAASVWEIGVPFGRLTYTLTAERHRGFSGEGALLTKLAAGTAADDAALVGAHLAFEPRIDGEDLARRTGLSVRRVGRALAALAVDGRVGYDLFEGAYFHRELPDDSERVLRDNPRLRSAHKLARNGAVRPFEGAPGAFWVTGDHGEYVVRTDPPSCSCPWWLRYDGGRGACKHVLAVQLTQQHRAQAVPGRSPRGPGA